MPYPEFRSWQLFYMLEPWGWNETELNVSRILAMMYNASGPKKAKAPKDFFRDMLSAVVSALKTEPLIDTSDEAGKRKATEFLVNMLSGFTRNVKR